MSKKKKLILETSKSLFNESGYSQVTIRMIALKMNMSSGNLNYHFQKREDIFEALYFEMVSEFDERINTLNTFEASIENFKVDIERSMSRMLEYKFFWTDLYSLLSISKKVKEHFQLVYKNRIDGCLIFFKKMKQKGLMQNSFFKLEYDFLAERMVNYGNTWLYSSSLYSNKLNAGNIDANVNIFLSMLYPYLTHSGKKEFQKLLPQFFE